MQHMQDIKAIVSETFNYEKNKKATTTVISQIHFESDFIEKQMFFS
jgi:hypothetical protein